MRILVFTTFMLIFAVVGISCGGSSSPSDAAVDVGKDSTPDAAADTSADGGAVDAPDAAGG